MNIFGGFLRGLKGKPPKLYPGEVVQWASAPTPGVFGETFPQRPYAVKLDADHQEISDRRWLAPEPFTNPDYMGAWQTWVEGQGTVSQPPYPAGSI